MSGAPLKDLQDLKDLLARREARIADLESVVRAQDRVLNAMEGPIRTWHARGFIAAFNQVPDAELRALCSPASMRAALEAPPSPALEWTQEPWYLHLVELGRVAIRHPS